MSHSNASPGGRAERNPRRHDRRPLPESTGQQAVRTDYSPALYAFRFPNVFVNQVWSGRLPPFIGRKYEISTRGRCGGMAFASLDFYHLKTPVPSLRSTDFAPLFVPPDGHPLGDYIYARQLHSMLTKVHGVRDGLRYLRWSGAPAATVFTKTSAEEKKVVESLDRGQPVVLGLIKATSRSLKAQGANHQVVCYGYRTDTLGHREFYVYDPNEPYAPSESNYEVILGLVDEFEGSGFPYQTVRANRIARWRGFFVVRYHPRQPGPAVIDGGSPANQ